jgi:hypothetical protein
VDEIGFDHVTRSDPEMKATHARWAQRRNRAESEDWTYDQCGRCRFWIPLAGRSGYDYGVCANAKSTRDGLVQFEHDSCDAYVHAGMWITPEDIQG